MNEHGLCFDSCPGMVGPRSAEDDSLFLAYGQDLARAAADEIPLQLGDHDGDVRSM
jgi:hypothetical protein